MTAFDNVIRFAETQAAALRRRYYDDPVPNTAAARAEVDALVGALGEALDEWGEARVAYPTHAWIAKARAALGRTEAGPQTPRLEVVGTVEPEPAGRRRGTLMVRVEVDVPIDRGLWELNYGTDENDADIKASVRDTAREVITDAFRRSGVTRGAAVET